MKPALTREEWEVEQSFPLSPGDWVEYFYDTPEDLHALAARCLHNQPFGFTAEMWDAVLHCIDITLCHGGPDEDTALAIQAADRIEALLPPEEGR